jgi:hypothetical protein
MTWWKAIEEHVAEREQDAPDPWGDRPLADPGLTEAQEEVLAVLDDQPRPGRLVDDGAPAAGERAGRAEQVTEETGNSPGDEGDPPGVPSPS